MTAGVVLTVVAASAGTATAAVRTEPLPPGAGTASRTTGQLGLPDSNWYLLGLDMLSDSDGWAVGGRQFSFNERPWVGHWDGQRWQRTFTPHRFTGDLSGVVALASNDVWAVGRLAKGKVGPLMLHWDGAEWRRYGHSPSDGALAGVSASGPDDVWAVGIMDQSGLVEHWDGLHWHSTQPAVAQGEYVTRVAAIAPDDVWAITNGTAIHWNGSSWRQVDLPDLGSPFGLTDITMLAPDDGWIVGQATPSKRSAPIALHWDGNDWTQVDVPRPDGTDPSFTAVSALTPDDVWAVGDQSGSDTDDLFIEHWDGDTWQLAKAPRTPPGDNLFADVDVLADDDIWTVGDIYNGPPGGFIGHWDGHRWTIDP